MKYRPEIDGLRSLAIVPILLFHAGVPVFRGGFVGVDIFFVISGYLITTMIVDDLSSGRFSILDFYKRRILRIVPAYSVVMIASLVLAFLFMLPAEFIATGKSIVAASMFASNIYFWMESGYFDAASHTKPVLHTWSLAVEEQFYVYFPLALIIVKRWLKADYTLWITLGVAASLCLSIVMVFDDPSAAFYLLPTRIWELELGALAAVVTPPRKENVIISNAASLLGIGLIVFSVFGLSESVPFPGYNALYPCLGAALLIAYGNRNNAARILVTAPAVYVGKISYSLYLWHWPVIVFYHMRFVTGSVGLDAVIVCIASVLLAVMSYYAVEMPFRTAEWRSRKAYSVIPWGMAVLALFVVAGSTIGLGLDPRKFPPDVIQIAEYSNYTQTADYSTQFDVGNCFISGEADRSAYDKQKCLALDPDRRNYLLLGDSHAAQYMQALRRAFPQINFVQTTVSGCRPIIDSEGLETCREIINDVLLNELPSLSLDGVIVAARWKSNDIEKIAPTLDLLRRYVTDVVVFGPAAEYNGEFPAILATFMLNHNPKGAGQRLLHEKEALSRAVAKAVQSQSVSYVDILSILCQREQCIQRSPDGGPMQFDYGHLTLNASQFVIDRVKQVWQPASSDR